MPTDPYVAAVADDAPRHRQNLPAGIAVPPARSWTGGRPGDLDAVEAAGAAPGSVRGALLGSPGPNVGYAISLVNRQCEQWHFGPHEDRHDAAAVVGEIAMKRAALFGRAPVKADVDFAAALLGYDGSGDATWVARRVGVVHGAEHHYEPRRALVDTVSEEMLRARPADIAATAVHWRNTTAPH